MVTMSMLPLVPLVFIVHSVASESCVTLTTFNAGLTPHVPNYPERKEIVPGALLEEGADIVCLQEIWREADMLDLLDVVGSVYPNHYSAIHSDVGSVRSNDESASALNEKDSGCDAGDLAQFLGPIMGCATLKMCTPLLYSNPSAGLYCLAQRCANELKDNSISEDCFSCLIMSLTTVDQAVEGCTNVDPNRPYNRFNGPGLLLLSKRPITNQRYQKYFDAKMALQRGYIEADIEGLGTVVCTHLSANLEHYYEFDLHYPNYEKQQAAEINIVGEALVGTDHIYSGDLNCGPIRPDSDPEKDLTGSMSDNYALLLNTYNYQEFYFDQDGRCTWCLYNNNTLDQANDVYDHVLIQGGAFSSVTTGRTLDQPDPDTGLYLSDHFGIRTTLCKA